MNAQETTDLALRFTADLSPWWLLLLLPIVGLIVWRLYRSEWHAITGKRHRHILLAMRLVLVLLVVLLAFRPDLIQRQVLTYPGRTLVVIDDSASMTAADTALPVAEALALSRTIDPPATEEAAPLFAAAGQLKQARQRLMAFERFSRDADRSEDAYWDAAAEAQDQITAYLDRADELVEVAAAQANAVPAELVNLRAGMQPLRGRLPRFFRGEQAPGLAAFEDYAAAANAARQRALTLQGMLDEQALAAGDERIAERLASVRRSARAELIAQRLGLIEPAPGVQAVSLMTGQPIDWPNAPPTIQAGQTDIVGRLMQLAQQPSDFPLEAIVLVSEGRDVVGRPTPPLEQLLNRNRVPVMSAAVGGATEPPDLALLELLSPPIAVADQPMSVLARIRASMDRPITTEATIVRDDGEVVATEELTFEPQSEQAVVVRFNPAAEGLHRYTLRLASVDGEVLPEANNAGDFVVNVQPRKVAVLLLDYRPRWQTRFVLNILRRLPYVELNPIILTTQPDAKLRRGAERGTWPATPAALAMYDIIVLGRLPDGLLSEAELQAVADHVQNNGKTLVRLTGRNEPIVERMDDLALTRAGQWHPLTVALAGQLAVRSEADPVDANGQGEADVDGEGGAEGNDGDAAEAPVFSAGALIVHRDRPATLLQAGFDAAGRTIDLDTDRFWEPLNPRHLAEHARMFVELVTWGIEAGRYGAGDAQRQADGDATGEAAAGVGDENPHLIVHRRRLTSDEPLAIGAANLPGDAVVEMVRDEQVIAQAAVEDGYAVFEGPAEGDVTLRVAGTPDLATPTIRVIRQSDELDRLARDEAHLRALASRTGGEYRTLADFDDLLTEIEPRQEVKRNERVWRLWDAWMLLVLLIVLISAEWVYRKLVGLV